MRDPSGRNDEHRRALLEHAQEGPGEIRVAELDVASQDSADAAVAEAIAVSGHLDVVVHNAGHLYVGYTEAFTDDDLLHQLDVNAVGAHRVNPYVASKAAFDAVAVTTSYEVNPFGIETVIVMPGALTEGTHHFPGASRASDADRSAAYADLDPLVARNEQATAALFPPGCDPSPVGIADEVARILDLPFGGKPFRSVVDYTDSGVEQVNVLAARTRQQFVRRLGFEELLRPAVRATVP